MVRRSCWASVAVLACSRPAELPVGAKVAREPVSPPAIAPSPAIAAPPISAPPLRDLSVGVVCERRDAEPLQLKPDGQEGLFRLEYSDAGRPPVSLALRCNPITSSRAQDLRFACFARADPTQSILKITTEIRPDTDEVGGRLDYLVHLHEVAQQGGGVARSEGDCVAYKFAEDGTRVRDRHRLELGCAGTLPGSAGAGACKVTTTLAFELTSFPALADVSSGGQLFDAGVQASVQIRGPDDTLLTEQSFAPAAMEGSAVIDFHRTEGGEVVFESQGGDYRAQTIPAVRAVDGGSFHTFDFIHFNDNETNFYYQPAPASPSLKRCEIVAPGDLRHSISDLKCTKKLTRL